MIWQYFGQWRGQRYSGGNVQDATYRVKSSFYQHTLHLHVMNQLLIMKVWEQQIWVSIFFAHQNHAKHTFQWPSLALPHERKAPVSSHRFPTDPRSCWPACRTVNHVNLQARSSKDVLKSATKFGGGGNSKMFLECSPQSLGKWSILTSTFFWNGLVQPPCSCWSTSWIQRNMMTHTAMEDDE